MSRLFHVLFLIVCVFGSAQVSFAQDAALGKIEFEKNCAACHQVTGKGIKGAFPALAGSVLAQGPETGVIEVVLKGRGGMPSFAPALDDTTLADILTYVRQAWGNHAGPVAAAESSKIRGTLEVDDPTLKGN
jgi:mono/diheme cytochrome c family protein